MNDRASDGAGRPRDASLRMVGRRALPLLLKTVLFASLLLIVLLFASSVVPSVLGYRAMIVTSGSMAPAIHAGDAVLVRPEPPSSIAVGDVVTFSIATMEGRGMGTTTHRVIDE